MKTKRAKLTKECDQKYSIYVRTKYADKNGMVACYTCRLKYPIKKIQNGHYIPRGYKHTRWDLNNLRPQCFMCNCRRYGNAFIFRANLVKEIGEEEVQAMEARAKKLFLEKDDWILAKINELPPTPPRVVSD